MISIRRLFPAAARAMSLILLMSLTLCLFSGCHGSRGLDPFQIPEAFDESQNYEITFWAKNDTNKNQTAIYNQAIAEFHKLYPNITVNIRLYTDYSKIYNDVITNISTNTTPNICITYPDHIATYLTGANVVVPLDDLLIDPAYGPGGSEVRFDAPTLEEIVPEFLEECDFAGHYYALPYMRSTEAVYINKTFVEALGYELPDVLTWDFVWEVADAAAQKDESGTYLVNGQKVMIPFLYKSTDNMMIQMLRQRNADYSTDEGDILLFNDETKDILFTVAEHAKRGSFSTFKISSYPANFLNAGQCLFAVDSTAGSTWMGTNAPLSDIAADKIVEFETAVRAVPQYDPNDPKMISQGPSVCIFNKADPQEVMASWLFVQYLLTNKVQINYAETEGYVPVTLKAQNDPDYLDYLSRGGEDNTTYYDVKIQATKLLIDNINNTFVTPVFNGSASLRDASGQLIENTVKSVNRKQTVDDAYMDNLFSSITSLYRLNSVSASSAGEKADLGPLPSASVALLAVLVVVWLLIVLYMLWDRRKSKQMEK